MKTRYKPPILSVEKIAKESCHRMLFLNPQPSVHTKTPNPHECSEENSEAYPFSMIAGPCSIESYELFLEVARAVKKQGATALRGGIFKMRTRSDAFQGLGGEALPIVKQVKEDVGLPFVCEITDPRQIAVLDEVVDVFQVGARNMHNYELLKELGKLRKPVLLKRGLAAYLDEFLAASEYVIKAGNSQVILCERGIRTFERSTRNTLDLSAVPYLKQKTGLPVIVDPSHGTGVRSLVSPMAWAAAAAGATETELDRLVWVGWSGGMEDGSKGGREDEEEEGEADEEDETDNRDAGPWCPDVADVREDCCCAA
jgi:3-deoxy-7-phosphoheptulonate synthase